MPNAKDLINKGKDAVSKGTKKIKEEVAPTVMQNINKAGETVKLGATAAMNVGNQAKDKVFESLDADGNGTLDINDIIILALKTPGIKVDREKFLRNEFKLHYDDSVIDKAIETTPLKAGILTTDIDKIADAVIQHERINVSGISAALGAPGGVAMVATIPADILQYYGYTLRVAQELMYLYGFPQIISTDEVIDIDTATMNTLIVALGTMFGVAGANNLIKAMAKGLGLGVEKQLMKKALTKSAAYKIIKGVTKWFSVNMTKATFAGFFKTAIPVVGGVIGGGVTYLSFKPCCDRLKNSLKDTDLSNANHVETKEEAEIFDAIVKEMNQ